MDYVINLKWNQKGNKAKKLIMLYYLSGLTKIIDNIEDGKISKNINIVGTSYFFSKNTAKKFGFTIEQVNLISKLLFLIDYVNLVILYSYSKGKIAFPKLSDLKTIKINAKNILKSKTIVKKYKSTIEKLVNKENGFFRELQTAHSQN
jgi:hypothetical protein